MKSRTGNFILFGMVIGAVLGVVLGYFFGDVMIHIRFLGTMFLNALKMVVVPLVVASIIIGVTSLGDIRKLGRTTGKTLVYYIATTSFSVLVGLILVNLIRPGEGVPRIGEGVPESVVAEGGGTIIDVIVGLIPENIFGAAAEGQILPLIVFSLLFGGVLTVIGRKGKPVIAFIEGINAAIMKIVMLIIYFAPIGILALIGGIVADNRESVDKLITALGLYSLTVIIGLLIHAVITLPLILSFFARKNPFRYFVNMGQALATAFTTASSSATLPVTLESVERKNKVDEKAASFVLPLGATINMDGTALYEAVAALFIAQIYGVDLSIGAQLIVFFTAILASVGAAAIPEAGLVMMSLVLTAVGLPLEGIGIILAIDWFLDRCRTTVNVWGDSVGAAVIGETSEMKDYSKPSRARESSRGRTYDSSRSRQQKAPSSHRSSDRKSGSDSSRDSRQRTGKSGRSRYSRNNRKSDRSSGRPGKPDGGAGRTTGSNRNPRNHRKQDYQAKKLDVLERDMGKAKEKLEKTTGSIDEISDGKSGTAKASQDNKDKNWDRSPKKPDAKRDRDKSKDEFFDIEFSRIDFSDNKDAADKSKSTPEKKSESRPETKDKSEDTHDRGDKKSGAENGQVEEAWGREKKKKNLK